MDKIGSLFTSRRFGVFIVAVLVAVFRDLLGLDEQTALSIAGVASAWIVGDAVRKTA